MRLKTEYIDFTKAPTKSANSDIISDFIYPPLKGY